MIKKYKKKPAVIEALQWTGDNYKDMYDFLVDINNHYFRIIDNGDGTLIQTNELYIKTLEGDHKTIVGDYIIKGVRGEFYPCKEYIFNETYEEVE